MSDGELILVAGALLAAGIAATLVAGRLRIPGLVLFLTIGMAVGTDGAGWIDFSDYELAQTIGTVALALILFEGGLTAGWGEIRPVLGTVVSLATAGTVVTAAITGLAATWLFGFSTLEGLLLGAVVASTDGAAIFAVLRGSTLRRRLARTLEGEAGMNDPVAVLLVLGFIDWIQKPGYGIADMAADFALELAIGLVVGLAVGWLAVRVLRRLPLISAGLYPVASLAIAALAFGGAAVLHGSGFLAVYLTGLAMASESIPSKRTIVAFHEGLAWVAQMVMFLALGLLVFPSNLDEVAIKGTLLAAVLTLVARPIGVFLATALTDIDVRGRLVLSWAGLRGAVPVVLATFPVIAGVPESVDFFNIVFFAVLLSTLVQGSTFEPVARRLGVTTREKALPPALFEVGMVRELGAEVVDFPVRPGDAVVGRRVRELDLPREAIVTMIARDDEALLPRGSTHVLAGDHLHVLVRHEVADTVPELLERWRSGPLGPGPPPPRRFSGTTPIFTVRPWRPADGDPVRPDAVAGHAVADLLRIRRDVPGALLLLDDGRYAVTGPQLVVGSREAMARFARRRLATPRPEAEMTWWQDVAGTTAQAAGPPAI